MYGLCARCLLLVDPRGFYELPTSFRLSRSRGRELVLRSRNPNHDEFDEHLQPTAETDVHRDATALSDAEDYTIDDGLTIAQRRT